MEFSTWKTTGEDGLWWLANNEDQSIEKVKHVG